MAFSKGDKITWNTPQGETHGEVVDKRVKSSSSTARSSRPPPTSRTTS